MQSNYRQTQDEQDDTKANELGSLHATLDESSAFLTKANKDNSAVDKSENSESTASSPAPLNLAEDQGIWVRASAARAIRPAILSVSLTIVIFLTVYIFTKSRLPNPKTYKPSVKQPFDYQNAKRHITHMGKRMRYVSTTALEDSLLYIQSEMNTLVSQAKQNGLDMEIDAFRSAPSSFSTSVSIIGIRQSYVNVSSIIVRLTPRDTDSKSDDDAKALLLNAHVDSAIGSFGVNDELSGVGILMELVRNIASSSTDSPHKLRRPVIFLFNGAEEVILQGAHSFVTQHPWAKNIVTHINLESLGSGSEYYLFRLGPNNPWLAHAYARAVSVPFASVTATDLFEANLVPGETDFRIFNEFGGIPGYDFVFLDNGYIYHTFYDDIDHLDDQGLLHAGITVHELLMELAGQNDAIGKHLASQKGTEFQAPMSIIRRISRHFKESLSSLYYVKNSARQENANIEEQKVSFFDIAHLFTIVYDEELAILFHTAALAFSVVVWTNKLARMSVREWLSCARMCIIVLMASLGAMMSGTYTAMMYARILKAPLIWYGSTLRVLSVFGPPTFAGLCTSISWGLPRRLPPRLFEYILFALSVIHFVFCVLLVRARAMSAFIPAILLTTCSIIGTQSSGNDINNNKRSISPLIKHIQLISVHALLTCRLFTVKISALLPIFGRVSIGGAIGDIDPNMMGLIGHDIFTAAIVSSTILIYLALPTIPILVHFAPALKRLRRMAVALSLWTAVLLIIVLPRMSNPENDRHHHDAGLITPYSKSAPKRLLVMHFNAPDIYPHPVLQVSALDSIDVNLYRLCAHLADEGIDQDIGTLPQRPEHGTLNITTMESFFPFGKLVHHTHWLRTGNAPDLPVPTAVVDQQILLDSANDDSSATSKSTRWNISIAIRAADSHQMALRMPSKNAGGIVSEWSFNSSLEDPSGYVFIKHHGSEWMRFWMIINGAHTKDDTNSNRPNVTMVLSSIRYGVSRSQKDLVVISKALEEWESAAFVASVAIEVTL